MKMDLGNFGALVFLARQVVLSLWKALAAIEHPEPLQSAEGCCSSVLHLQTVKTKHSLIAVSKLLLAARYNPEHVADSNLLSAARNNPEHLNTYTAGAHLLLSVPCSAWTAYTKDLEA